MLSELRKGEIKLEKETKYENIFRKYGNMLFLGNAGEP